MIAMTQTAHSNRDSGQIVLNKKILVTGKNGMLGTDVLDALVAVGFQTVGLGREDADITDTRAVRDAMLEHEPDLVIHTAAMTAVDACEDFPDKAMAENSTGAMHVAAAPGRPVVAMFGPTDERVTRPIGRGDVLTADVFCRPCHLRDCPIDHRCMTRIDVNTVFAAVSRHLAYSTAQVAP